MVLVLDPHRSFVRFPCFAGGVFFSGSSPLGYLGPPSLFRAALDPRQNGCDLGHDGFGLVWFLNPRPSSSPYRLLVSCFADGFFFSDFFAFRYLGLITEFVSYGS